MNTSTTYKKLKPTKIFFAAVFVFLMVGNVSATTYYGINNSNVNVLTSWGINSGGGGTRPTVWTNAADIFIIESGNSMTQSAAWTISGTFTINFGGTFTSSGAYNLTAPTINVNGIYVNGSTGTITHSGTMTVGAGGTFQLNVNGGTIPTATWNAASNCLITGATGTSSVGGWGTQSFGNLTWNCTSQSIGNQIAGTCSVQGTLKIMNTNGQTVQLGSGSGNTLIAANYLQTGGTAVIGNGSGTSNTKTLTITGNFELSGGTLNIDSSTGGGTCTYSLNVGGNFTIDGGTFTRTSATTSTCPVNFNGTTTQTFSYTSGTLSGNINYNILSNAIVDFGTYVLTGTGSFTLNSGANIITAHTQGLSISGATGSIQTTGTRTYNVGGNYIYDGTSAQVTGNGLTQNTPANLTINSTNTVSLSAATIITGDLLISQGTLSTSANNYSMTVGGNWTNNGTFTPGTGTVTFNTATAGNIGTSNFNNVTFSGAGTKTATGILTIAGNISISNNFTAGAFTHTVSGNWTNTGTFTATGSTIDFNGASAGNIGASNFNNVTFSGAGTKTATGILTIAGNISISNNFTAGAFAHNVAGNWTNNGGTFTPGTGTFIFNANAAQTIGGSTSTTFNNLVFSGSGAKSIPSGTSVTGNLSIAPTGSATASIAAGQTINVSTLTLGGNGAVNGTWGSTTATSATYHNDTYFAATTGLLNVSTSTCSASPSSPTTTGAFICIGTVAGTTLSASGAVAGQKYNWYSAASGGTPLYTSANNTVNTYTTPVIGATTSYWVTIMNPYGCESPRVQVTAAYPALSGDVQTLAGTDSWIGHVYDGTNSGVAYNGNFTNYYGHSTETEIFNESFGGSTTCYPILSGSNALSIYTETFSVRYRMNSTKKGLWIVDMGSDDGNRLAVDGTLIYNDFTDHGVNNNLRVLMSLTGSSSLIYDYYENGGGNQVYYQNLIQILANTLSTNTTQTINIGNSGAAISGDVYGTLPTGITLSGTGYQWVYSTTPGGATTAIAGATGATYTPDASIAPFNTPNVYYVYRNALLNSANNKGNTNPYLVTNTSNAANITITAPVITVTGSPLTGFTYAFGAGPSSEKTFSVSGNYLNANVTVTPPAHYEISTGTGGSFVATNLITLAVNGGTLSSTTIHVRLKAGLAQASYNLDSIKVATTDAITQNVVCSGTVTAGPVVTVSPASLTGFAYTYPLGPSAQQTFNVSGTNLLGNVTLTPPSDFEISTDNTNFYSTALTITASGTLASTPVYVRMKAGLGVGSRTQNVVASSASAPSLNVSCTGTVSPAATILNPTSLLSTFIYTLGSGPSGQQTFTVSGSTLTTGITITPLANFEISTTSGSGFQTGALTLPESGGVINTTTIYVRMVYNLPVGNYGPSNIVLSTAGATSKSVSCSGSVVDSSTPTILVSKSTLTGFGYQAAAGGPSSDQNFTVSGSSLSTNITIAPPASYYEITLTSGSGYQSTNLTLPQTYGRVNPTIIYLRLKSGFPAGDYTGTITASAGTPSKTVSLVGKVFASPLITASSSPGSPYCLGSTINLVSTGADIQNRYWLGPNNYYSTQQSTILTTNATAALSGTYTVTGNVTVGGNLVTNGDFESGNTSFGSGYSYVAPIANALYPEGLYTVTSKPSNVHDQFNSVGDYPTGTGQQMVVNGNTVAGVVVWTQSVPVIPGANYQFTYWEQTVNLNNTYPSQLQLYVNGVSAGPIYTASVPNGNWSNFLYNASAGSNTVLNLELINKNLIAGGNDFAMDNIVFQQILSATESTDVTVAASVPVSVSIAASSNPSTAGATVTFTATPTNGGTSPAYVWYKNNVIVPGVTGSTYSYVPANNDQIKCVLTSSITCTTNNPATSSTIAMVVNPATNYWKGTTNTDWGTASNWTAGFVPAPGADVIYATVANWGSVAIRDLVLDQDRTQGN